MLYIEQLHSAMVNIEIEIVEYRHEEEYVSTLIDLYKRTLDIAVSRVLGELCNSTSLPPEHQFIITHDNEPLLTQIVLHSTGKDCFCKYSDAISKNVCELDLYRLLHFNQEVHEFKHFILQWYEEALDLTAANHGLNKMNLGVMCLKG